MMFQNQPVATNPVSYVKFSLECMRGMRIGTTVCARQQNLLESHSNKSSQSWCSDVNLSYPSISSGEIFLSSDPDDSDVVHSNEKMIQAEYLTAAGRMPPPMTSGMSHAPPLRTPMPVLLPHLRHLPQYQTTFTEPTMLLSATQPPQARQSYYSSQPRHTMHVQQLHFQPGMKDVPVWLKGLRLHKYTPMFAEMSYEEMLSLDEIKLEQRHVTKGARRKIVQSIQKLKNRAEVIRDIEKNLPYPGTSNTGCVRCAIACIRQMLSTPIKAYTSQPDEPSERVEGIVQLPLIRDENLPGLLGRLLMHVNHLVFPLSRQREDIEDEFLLMMFHIFDRILNNDAFTSGQKQRILTMKRAARKYVSPAELRRHRLGTPLPHTGRCDACHHKLQDMQAMGLVGHTPSSTSTGFSTNLRSGMAAPPPLSAAPPRAAPTSAARPRDSNFETIQLLYAQAMENPAVMEQLKEMARQQDQQKLMYQQQRRPYYWHQAPMGKQSCGQQARKQFYEEQPTIQHQQQPHPAYSSYVGPGSVGSSQRSSLPPSPSSGYSSGHASLQNQQMRKMEQCHESIGGFSTLGASSDRWPSTVYGRSELDTHKEVSLNLRSNPWCNMAEVRREESTSGYSSSASDRSSGAASPKTRLDSQQNELAQLLASCGFGFGRAV